MTYSTTDRLLDRIARGESDRLITELVNEQAKHVERLCGKAAKWEEVVLEEEYVDVTAGMGVLISLMDMKAYSYDKAYNLPKKLTDFLTDPNDYMVPTDSWYMPLLLTSWGSLSPTLRWVWVEAKQKGLIDDGS